MPRLAMRHASDADPLLRLCERYSQGIKHLGEPGPDAAQLRRMTEAALRAPDHGELVPFRLRAVQGEARAQLAELFAAAAERAGKRADAVAMERERALRAPLTVAVVARIDPGHPVVPAHEQWACIGGAVTNFLNAAHLQGFAGKMLSGLKVRDPGLVTAFCEPGESLLGWIAVGTATRVAVDRSNKPSPDDVLTAWRAPGAA